MTQNARCPIVVVGSSNTDLIVRAPRLPRPGETVLGGEFSRAAGGKGANQAVAAARLGRLPGGRVALLARLGADPMGDSALAGFATDGIDAAHIVRDPDAPSGTALITVDTQTGENTIVVAGGANSNLSPADVQAAAPLLQRAKIVLCQLEVPLPTVQAALALAHDAHVTTILNPAPAQALPDDLLRLVSILTPNETEATLLTELVDPAQAASALVSRGVPTVLVTVGASGAFLATPAGTRHLPGFAVPLAVDTTAAGDCFCGALAVALAEGQAVEDAARFAHAAAALCVTRQGAQPSLPTRAEVNSFLAAQ